MGYAFVDDTDLVSSTYLPSTLDSVYAGIQHSLNAWRSGIHASGGAIVPEKSHWYLIDFKWTNGVPNTGCRIILFSDITCGFGTSILSDAWDGRKSLNRSPYNWPNQALLPPDHWITWRTVLGKLCSRARILRRPLGKWLSSRTPTFFYDIQSVRVYASIDKEVYFYIRQMAGVASRSNCGRYGNQ